MIAGLVLAAGSSLRLGQPKQLLPIGGVPLLDHTLRMVRRCGLDQIVVALGGSADDVREGVDLDGCDVVENREFTTGCSSTIVSAIGMIDSASRGLVLFLGDQPLVEPATVGMLVSLATAADTGVCRYSDGLGHPLWFNRSMFPELGALRGDKAVWKLLSAGRFSTVEVSIRGPIPLDVDTRDDYEALRARLGQPQTDPRERAANQ